MTSYRAKHSIPDLGVGIGARPKHYPAMFGPDGAAAIAGVDWLEIVSENFMVGGGGKPQHDLERLLERRRVVPHGVSLSIGGTKPLDRDYLRRLKALVRRVAPPWCSDHLCFTGTSRIDVHDLLPLPYTEEAVEHVVARLREVQDVLEVPFAIENVSSYMTYRGSTMTEWQFLAEVAERADCGILFDCNNVYVSAFNHGFDPNAYVDAVPADRVVQMHLAGHTDKGKYLLDTHSDRVCDAVWDLYRRSIRRTGPVATLIEWDEQIPALEVVVGEAERARAVRGEALA